MRSLKWWTWRISIGSSAYKSSTKITISSRSDYSRVYGRYHSIWTFRIPNGFHQSTSTCGVRSENCSLAYRNVGGCGRYRRFSYSIYIPRSQWRSFMSMFASPPRTTEGLSSLHRRGLFMSWRLHTSTSLLEFPNVLIRILQTMVCARLAMLLLLLKGEG